MAKEFRRIREIIKINSSVLYTTIYFLIIYYKCNIKIRRLYYIMIIIKTDIITESGRNIIRAKFDNGEEKDIICYDKNMYIDLDFIGMTEKEAIDYFFKNKILF